MSKSREDFLIWQYRGKPKARQTVGLLLSETKTIFESVTQLADTLNIDTATGYALDLVGSHVGIGRVLKSVIPKDYFGWVGISSAQGFNTGRFYRFGDPLKDVTRLDDEDYRFFIKAKAIKNYQSGDIANITQSVRLLLGSQAYVIDNLDMTMNIVVSNKELTELRLYAIRDLDILSRPVGVKYRYLIITDDKPFGWASDDSSFGFNQGKFTRLLNANN